MISSLIRVIFGTAVILGAIAYSSSSDSWLAQNISYVLDFMSNTAEWIKANADFL